MHLAPLTTIVSAMHLRFPLAFAEHLDPRAIDQQVQGIVLATIGNDNLQVLLTP